MIRTTVIQCHGMPITLQLSLFSLHFIAFLYCSIALELEIELALRKEAPRDKDQFVTKKQLEAKVDEESECPNPRTKTGNSNPIK